MCGNSSACRFLSAALPSTKAGAATDVAGPVTAALQGGLVELAGCTGVASPEGVPAGGTGLGCASLAIGNVAAGRVDCWTPVLGGMLTGRFVLFRAFSFGAAVAACGGRY